MRTCFAIALLLAWLVISTFAPREMESDIEDATWAHGAREQRSRIEREDEERWQRNQAEADREWQATNPYENWRMEQRR